MGGDWVNFNWKFKQIQIVERIDIEYIFVALTHWIWVECLRYHWNILQKLWENIFTNTIRSLYMGRDNWQTTLMKPRGSGLKNWDAISANEWGTAAILVNFHAAIQWLNRKRAIGFAQRWEKEKGMTEIEKGSKGFSTCTNCCRGRHRICIAGQVEGSFKVASIKLLAPCHAHTPREEQQPQQ